MAAPTMDLPLITEVRVDLFSEWCPMPKVLDLRESLPSAWYACRQPTTITGTSMLILT